MARNRNASGPDAGLAAASPHYHGQGRLRTRFRIPSSESALIAEIHRVGHVLDLKYEENDALIVAHVPPQLEQKLAHYSQ